MLEDSPNTDETEPYTARIDRDQSEGVVSAIVSSVAARTGRGVTDLPPLYDVIDPEALQQVFASLSGPRRRSNDGRFVFTYAGCEVMVDGNDELTVRLLEEQQGRK